MTASLVLYGGTGVNVVIYCCNDCRTKGIEAVVDDKCCDVHNREQQDNQSDSTDRHHTNCVHSSGKDCCSFERIDFEWNVYKIVKVEFYRLMQTANLPVYINLSEYFDTEEITLIKSEQKHPPAVLPREYLSSLSVLLI